jgi:hypothetical protein
LRLLGIGQHHLKKGLLFRVSPRGNWRHSAHRCTIPALPLYILQPMLRRLSRPLSALFALWFSLVLVDPGVLHACAMHGGAHATSAASSAAPGIDHAAHHGSEQQPASEPTVCSCVGQCCAVVPTLLPAEHTFSVPAHVARVAGLFAQASGHVPTSPDLRLPFANGPPRI